MTAMQPQTPHRGASLRGGRRFLLEALMTGQLVMVNYSLLRALVALSRQSGDLPSEAEYEALIDRWLGEHAKELTLWPTR